MEKHDQSRRNFVKLGAMGAGALALGATGANAQPLNEKDVKFDGEYDVIVIGTGFAGLAAASKAGKRGYKVLVLDKMGRLGGDSVINGGAMAVPESADQKKFGIKDSVERFKKDCLKAGLGLNHPELLEVVATRSKDAKKFAEECGAKFMDGKKPIMFGGHSVPRTIITANGSGSGIIQPMVKTVEATPGCKIMKRTKFDEFVLDDNGRVIGVTARTKYKFNKKLLSDDAENKKGKPVAFKAKKGVILATGGFSADKVYRKLQDPRLAYDQDTTNHAGSTAGGLLAAFKIGALPVQVSWIQRGPWASPDERGFGVAPLLTQQGLFQNGIAVDIRNGKRFMNELADRRERANAEYAILLEDKDKYPVALGTANSFAEQVKPKIEVGLKKGVMKKFDTLDALAKEYGIPAKALKETVATYNANVKKGVDPEFNKPVKMFKGVGIEDKGPYYAIRLVPKPHHTMGGLKINTKAQVISSETFKPIPGLYAAGEVTGGTHGACRLGSVAVADCLVFGMIAGENI